MTLKCIFNELNTHTCRQSESRIPSGAIASSQKPHGRYGNQYPLSRGGQARAARQAHLSSPRGNPSSKLHAPALARCPFEFAARGQALFLCVLPATRTAHSCPESGLQVSLGSLVNVSEAQARSPGADTDEGQEPRAAH